MHLFLDNIVFTIQQAGGVSMYWYELFQQLRKSPLVLSVLNANAVPGNIFEQRIDYNGMHCIRESRIPARYLRYLPLRCKLPPRTIFHAGYFRVSTQQNVVNIVTVHDFAHERKMATRFPRNMMNILQKSYGIRHADGIICISDSTRRELLHFYPETDHRKIKVIYHGIAADFYRLPEMPAEAALLPFDIREKYVLYVGARSRYKNFRLAVEAVAALPHPCKLVITGGETWQPAEKALLQRMLPGRFVILPAVDIRTLNLLYNYAFCLLYPSAYEGFGFPPAEAMKAGCPVITANTTAMPEVAGDAGVLADDLNAASFTEKLHALEADDYRQAVIGAGQARAAQFTWERCAGETIQFYQDSWQLKFSS